MREAREGPFLRHMQRDARLELLTRHAAQKPCRNPGMTSRARTWSLSIIPQADDDGGKWTRPIILATSGIPEIARRGSRYAPEVICV